MKNNKLISLSGDRPTGQLHIGHLIGSLLKRVELQDTHNSYVMIADAQAYSDHIKNREKVSSSIMKVMEDYLSVGIDPQKSTLFLQSAVPEIQELAFYLSNVVTLSRLERIPTIKNEIIQKFTSSGDNSQNIPRDIPVGFLTYAISQSADILSFDTDIVPVGQDQVPIIELTNEISKSVNKICGKDVFKSCRYVLNEQFEKTLLGVDGKSKMSKTLGNTIDLNSSPDEIKKKVKKMYTDPLHLHISDPGHIEGNMVFYYLDIFYENKFHLEELKEHYQKGGLGDGVVKKILTDVLIEYFAPIQKRRALLDRDFLVKSLKEGTEKAREVAALKTSLVKKSLGLSIF